jgi:membrane-bound serine protease (ClpP class)
MLPSTDLVTRSTRFLGVALCTTIALCGLAIGQLHADQGNDAGQREDGLFITVPNPITSEIVSQIRETINRARKRSDRKIRTIVLDFNPDGKEAGTPTFGPCYDLAQLLDEQRDLTTVAFLRAKTHRHTLLPVLACRETAMGRDAVLGEVYATPGNVPEEQQLIYSRFVGENRAGLAARLLNRNAKVYEGKKAGATWFVEARKADEARAKGVILDESKPAFPIGSELQLRYEDARRVGLARVKADTRQDIAEAYGLSASSLREDPLQGRTPVVWRIEVRGTVNAALRESLQRRIKSAIANRANVLIFQLECGGGDMLIAQELAESIRKLRDDAEGLPVMSIAYIPKDAPDTAAVLAFGCTEIVMAPGSTLGKMDALLSPRAAAPPPPPRRRPIMQQQQPPGKAVEQPEPAPVVLQDASAYIPPLSKLLQEQGYPEALAEALLSPQSTVLMVVSNDGGPIRRRLMTLKEYEEDQAGAKRWREERRIKEPGQPFWLDTTKAREFGVARHVDVKDARELYGLYGLDPTKVREAGPDWLDSLAAFLRDPYVSFFLIVIGFGCLILELKIPGMGIPGVISALCFVLFFWARLLGDGGQLTVLGILLFLLGLVLLAVEIFILPGFGVTGLSGIVLIVLGLGLATINRLPQTANEWLDFGNTVMGFGLGLIAATILALVIARYLPNIPYVNRLVLAPPTESPAAVEEKPALPGVEEAAALLGAIGTAATPLRPAGMAQFGDRYVDVITEGGYVEPGARVQVIEVEGNRIVVKLI